MAVVVLCVSGAALALAVVNTVVENVGCFVGTVLSQVGFVSVVGCVVAVTGDNVGEIVGFETGVLVTGAVVGLVVSAGNAVVTVGAVTESIAMTCLYPQVWQYRARSVSP